MATIERAVSAQSLFWIKTDEGDRIGLVWDLEGAWHWSVGRKSATDAQSYDDAIHAVEAALGAPLRASRGRRAA
jgi:hypothetical protein